MNEKYNKINVAGLALIILLACLYSQSRYGDLTLKDCLTGPDKCDGATLKLGNNTRAGKVQEDRFEILKGDSKINVIGSVDGLKTNDYVEMIAVFHKEGHLELKDIYVRKLRVLKIFISVVPVFFVAWLFIRQYRFDFTRRVFIQKQRCPIL